MKLLLCLCLGWFLCAPLQAAINAYSFSSPEQEQRFRQLTEELRCPRCQNESLAGSDAPVAQDLKDRVYLMLQAGKSNRDIKEFLRARYGDFVIYRPPLRWRTLVLWLGPWVLGMTTVLLLWRRLRQKNTAARALSPEEQQRLALILGTDATLPSGKNQ